MGELGRKLRNANNDIVTLMEDDNCWPFQTEAQEEFVNSYQEIHDRLSNLWRGMFLGIFCVYISVLVCSMYQQFMRPWELSYHACFKRQVDSVMVIVADGLALVACVLAVYCFSCACEHQKRRLIRSSIFGAMVAIFWLYHMINSWFPFVFPLKLPKFPVDIIWFPFAPVCCSLVGLYVTNLLAEPQDAIHKLRAAMDSCNKS